MTIAVLGTGVVGKTLAAGYLAHGHDVVVGTRDPERDDLVAWATETGVALRTFADAAAAGDLVVFATAGGATAEVAAGVRDHVAGKTVIDAANPLGHGDAGPFLTITGDDSLGESVQRTLPDARVVKAYNTVGANLMVDPQVAGGPPTMFIAGNDDAAKAEVTALLQQTGWDIADLGGIVAARWLEAMCMAWVSYGLATGTWDHAFKLLHA